MALMLGAPFCKSVVGALLATPLTSGTGVPKLTPLIWNWTVPVGTPPAAETEATRVTYCVWVLELPPELPEMVGSRVVVSDVVVIAREEELTVCVSDAPDGA